MTGDRSRGAQKGVVPPLEGGSLGFALESFVVVDGDVHPIDTLVAGAVVLTLPTIHEPGWGVLRSCTRVVLPHGGVGWVLTRCIRIIQE